MLLNQGRNHIFKVGGPGPWSRVLLPFYDKRLDRSTQFGALGYIITLFIKKLRENLGAVQIFGGPDPPQFTFDNCTHNLQLSSNNTNNIVFRYNLIQPGAQPRLQSWEVQFLGLGYYYPSTEKN